MTAHAKGIACHTPQKASEDPFREVSRDLKIHIADIQPPDRYPCTLRQVNELFGHPPLSLLGFGWPEWTFVADPQCRTVPDLDGVVLASVTYGSDRETTFTVYPVHHDRFTDAAQAELVTTILPRLRQRLDAELEAAAASPIPIGQLVVEWNAPGFRIHTLR